MAKMCSREAELRCFWDASTELHRTRRAGASLSDISNFLEELEMIGKYSDWPALKAVCALTAQQTEIALEKRAANA